MKILNALEPTPEQIKAFLTAAKPNVPVYMLNLLKFKDAASYKDAEAVTGREAYGRYAAAFRDLSIPLGAEFIYSGNANTVMIGSADWDAVAIVKYPDAQTMFTCVSSEAYRAIYKHRKAGLEAQILISCDAALVL